MSKTETLGAGSGALATVSLANVNLLVGIAAGLITIICLIPSGVTKWRNLLYDYRKHQARSGDYGLFAFPRYCLGGMQKRPEDRNAVPPGDFTD